MPTVTRVLPWKRHIQPPQAEVADIVEQFKRFHPRRQPDVIVAAYEIARGAHRGQLRRSGEPYITHPLAVAGIVAQYGMDDVSIAAALLHDAVEDTVLTLEEIDEKFGPEVTAIVDGVTKLERVHFDSKEAQQAATLRKMLVAMAKDVRVLIIKLADRLHNMRTIAALPAWKQERKDRIVGRDAITVAVRNLKVTLDGDKAAASFQQYYASGSYKATTRKTLRMQREGNQWRIVREETGR
jgi:GTP pyrophosphokinase